MPFFIINNYLLDSGQIASLGEGFDPSALANEITEAGEAKLLQAILRAGEPLIRILVYYDNINGGLEASFDYPDTIRGASRLTPDQLMDQWIISMGGVPFLK